MGRATPPQRVALVLELKRAGLSDAEVCRQTGVPVNTIRLWRRKGIPRAAERVLSGRPICAECGAEAHRFDELPRATYAYLLGLYLGDGTLGRVGNSWSLRIFMDEAYPNIISECSEAIAGLRGRPPQLVRRGSDEHYVILTSVWKSWGCVIPQHGPGMKHTRRIVLAPWQRSIVEAQPGRFLRGLIHSDGWRGLNRVHVKGRDYEYPRYQFSNRSDDIRKLFTDSCDCLGVEWKPWTRFHISVARRDSVALLDLYVGPKR